MTSLFRTLPCTNPCTAQLAHPQIPNLTPPNIYAFGHMILLLCVKLCCFNHSHEIVGKLSLFPLELSSHSVNLAL